MNEQVRNYFKMLRFRQLTEMPEEKKETLLLLGEMAKGTGINITIEEDDFDFIWMVRRKYKKGGHSEGMMPSPAKVLQVKYCLLEPSPLNDFYEAEEDGAVKIYRRGDKSLFATVNDSMRTNYKKAKGGDADDKTVAKWWIEDSRDAVFSKDKEGYVRDASGNASPQSKIIRRGSDSVSLAFRSSKKFWGWTVVEDIPVNMAAFRERVVGQGYNEKVHRGEIQNITLRTWENLAASKAHDDAPEEDGVKRTGRKDPKKTSFSPGLFSKAEDPSNEFMERYQHDLDFRKVIEKIVIRTTTAALKSRGIYGYFIDEESSPDHVTPDENKEVVGAWKLGDTNYRIVRKGDNDFGVENVKNVLNDSRMHVFRESGLVNFDWKTAHIDLLPKDKEDVPDSVEGSTGAVVDWIKRRASTGALNSIAAIFKLNKQEKTLGRTSSSEDGKEITAADLGDQRAAAAVRSGRHDIEDDEPEPEPEIPQQTPKIPDVDDRYANYNVDEPEKPFDPTAPVAPVRAGSMKDLLARRRMQQQQQTPVESFKQYVAQRDMNEMEVVWGNDKTSAKKLKPGQTLKGGIQVQGAPWSADGKVNRKENDIKLK